MNANGIKLTSEQVRNLMQAEHSLSIVLQDYDKAEKCGADCQEMRALVAEAIANSQEIRKQFGS